MKNYPKIEEFGKGKHSHRTETYLRMHFPEFYEYLDNQYPKDLKWSEKLYWYYHGITNYPTCPECGGRTTFMDFTKGYCGYCSTKCMRNSEEVKEKTKKTNLERYGFEQAFKNKELQEKQKHTFIERYGVEYALQNSKCREKFKQTCLKRYGVENAFQNKELQGKQKQTCIDRYNVTNISQLNEIKKKKKQTCLKHYGTEVPMQLDEIKNKIKQTCLEKYGETSFTKTAEYRQKAYETKKKNHSFNSSKIEHDFKQWLEDHNIDYRYQYKSEEYPFNCDFYLPEKDLYLEIQGFHTHGKHPFNPDDPKDQEILEQLKRKNYFNAIETWTIRDPLKRFWAKEHSLNWVEVFSTDLEDVIQACGL